MNLQESYYEIFGRNDLTDYRFHQLEEIMERAAANRSGALKKADRLGSSWYQSQNMAGIMLYLDRFSENLTEFEKRIGYLAELGVTYVHFMPLLQAREGDNDGGYAVADYLSIDKRLGDMKQFERVVALLKKNGIRTCIDFVLNHTAKEHEWARRCVAGEEDYRDMYHMFPDDTIPGKYEQTMTEIFPGVAPGNFTWYEDQHRFVMTRFYEFQWDLNYANPQVFNKIVEVLLTLANKGVDIFRLDAIPYMWKQLGTSCMNLPQVHTLIRMMRVIVEQVCPSVIFLGEAIVEPYEIVKYFGSGTDKECHVMYNASMMVLLWNSLATRDVRLMMRSLSKDYGVPEDGVWINYARCHDDMEIAHDSRWLHRGKMDWSKAERRNDLTVPEGQIFTGIKRMLTIRKNHDVFASTLKSIPVDTWNHAVFGFHKGDRMMVLANFSEQEQWVEADSFSWFGLPGEMTYLIQGRPVMTYHNRILLGPYEYLWLV